jgi:hypothetical protein
MIRHAVYFWLNDPGSFADRDRLLAGLRALDAIPQIRGIELGVPADTGHRDVVDASWSVSSLVLFDTEADEAIYQDHPLHQRFIAECGDTWSKVVVYDTRDAG